MPTLQEYLDLVKGNADRVVGIYPETKHPTWHDGLQLACTNGTSFTNLLLQVCFIWDTARASNNTMQCMASSLQN